MSKKTKKVIIIDGVNYVNESEIETISKAEPVDGLLYCIIRCNQAGVHAGFVKDRKNNEVTLIKTRRLWRWYGATLSGLAKDGTPSPDKCKFSDEIAEITVLDACEVIPCTQKAIDSLRSVKDWVNE